MIATFLVRLDWPFDLQSCIGSRASAWTPRRWASVKSDVRGSRKILRLVWESLTVLCLFCCLVSNIMFGKRNPSKNSRLFKNNPDPLMVRKAGRQANPKARYCCESPPEHSANVAPSTQAEKQGFFFPSSCGIDFSCLHCMVALSFFNKKDGWLLCLKM